MKCTDGFSRLTSTVPDIRVYISAYSLRRKIYNATNLYFLNCRSLFTLLNSFSSSSTIFNYIFLPPFFVGCWLYSSLMSLQIFSICIEYLKWTAVIPFMKWAIEKSSVSSISSGHHPHSLASPLLQIKLFPIQSDFIFESRCNQIKSAMFLSDKSKILNFNQHPPGILFAYTQRSLLYI